MTRRALFAALASLPFVGRFFAPADAYVLLDSEWASSGVGKEQGRHFPGGGHLNWRCGGCKQSMPPSREFFFKQDAHGGWTPKCLDCAATGRVLPWPEHA